MPVTREQVEANGKRLAGRGVYLGNCTVVAQVLGKFRMILDSSDRGIVPHLLLDGFWESWVTAWVINNVAPGSRALNLGANCGYYTMLLADLVGPTGRVLAVEPNPSHAENIFFSAHLNGFAHVEVVRGVVGDEAGHEVELSFRPGMTMNASLRAGPTEGCRVLRATMHRVDALTADWDRVDFALIDTEGAEPLVIEGMRQVIRENPRFRALIEFSPQRYDDPAAFVAELEKMGFGFRVVGPNGQASVVRGEALLDDVERMVVLSR